MAVETVALFDALMKDLYAGKAPYNVASRNRAFLSMVSKVGGFVGESKVIPIIYGNPTGRSATPATAYAATTGGVAKARFTVTRHADYASTNISGELLHASKSDRGAFAKALEVQVDGMLDELGHSLSLSCYRNGGGARGQIGTDGGATLTLTNAADASNFRVGMTLVSSSTDGTTGSVDGESTGVAITDIDEEAGTLTMAGAGSFGVNEYLFCKGDFGQMVKGLDAYIPVTPSADLYGLDQTAHREMLAGTYVADTSYSKEEAILVTAEKVHKRGGRPTHCFISHENFTDLVFGRESKVVTESGGMETIGFRGFPVEYSGGTLRVYPDPDCPPDAGYVLTLSTWELAHMEGLPHLVKDDGLRSLRNSDDSIQVRGRYWAALTCYAPAWNGRFAISTD